MKRTPSLLILSFSLALTGCGFPSVKAKMLSQKMGASMPDLVAILPPENQSNDMTSIEVIQRASGVMLGARGYFSLSNKAQDEALRQIGLTDGGQVRAYKAADLCNKLGVQGLAYPTVEDFNEINIGFWMSKKVQLKVKLTDCNEEVLWEGWGRFSVKKIEINPQAAAQAFVERKVGELVEKALKVHLVPEANSAALKLSEQITPWPDLATASKR